ncbi:MAG TPA: GH25 family lysozyme [Elusimicrobiota bacterium]|nr:GH25 family lysozyme [Elusimicrobiota bacterium]
MTRSPAPLALLAILAAAASFGQDFPAIDDVSGQLSGIRRQTLQLQAIPQVPVYRAMGSGSGAAAAESAIDAAGTPDVTAYGVRGIDISHYQHRVDWSVVKNDGLSFVYMKATEGAEGVDEEFAANWAGAKTAGLRRGAYHFYNFCKGGAAQAALFVKTVPADSGALPPTVDLEDSGDCKAMPAKAAFRKSFAAFVTAVQAAYGTLPVIYVNSNIYAKYFEGENDAYKVWVADVKHASPDVPGWTIWQYGWHGTVAGIAGEVDLDVFNGTPEMLAALDSDDPVLVAGLGPR